MFNVLLPGATCHLGPSPQLLSARCAHNPRHHTELTPLPGLQRALLNWCRTSSRPEMGEKPADPQAGNDGSGQLFAQGSPLEAWGPAEAASEKPVQGTALAGSGLSHAPCTSQHRSCSSGSPAVSLRRQHRANGQRIPSAKRRQEVGLGKAPPSLCLCRGLSSSRSLLLYAHSGSWLGGCRAERVNELMGLGSSAVGAPLPTR